MCVCLELNGTFLINEIEFLLFNKYVSWNQLLLRGGKSTGWMCVAAMPFCTITFPGLKDEEECIILVC